MVELRGGGAPVKESGRGRAVKLHGAMGDWFSGLSSSGGGPGWTSTEQDRRPAMECGGGSTPAALGGGKWDGELPGGGRKLAAGLSRVEEARSKGV